MLSRKDTRESGTNARAIRTVSSSEQGTRLFFNPSLRFDRMEPYENDGGLKQASRESIVPLSRIHGAIDHAYTNTGSTAIEQKFTT